MISWQKKILLAFLVCLLAFPLGARLAGDNKERTGIGEVAFHALPHFPGGGELYVPLADWGLGFRLFHSPVLVRAEPRSIDREAALAVATGDEPLLRSVEEDIYSGAREAVIRTLLVALLIVLFASWALYRAFPKLGREFIWEAPLLGCALSVGVFLLALLTYSPESLERPSFYARGAELDQILASIERERDGGDGSYEDNFREILSSVGSLLSGEPIENPSGGKKFVLASDLHSNSLALPALADMVGDKPLLFAGDFGLDGNDTEAALLAEEMAQLGPNVFAVSGNHDSTALMQSLADAGVQVLSEKGTLGADGAWEPGAVRVGGLEIRGWADPLQWSGEPEDPERPFSLDASSRHSARKDLWNWWQTLSKKPDILMIHQPELAEFLAGKLRRYPRTLAIVTGHDHRQWVARQENIFIVDGGSVGAGGIFGVGRESAEMAELYFSESGGNLKTVDMIQINPIEGGGRAERVVADRVCFLPCRYRIPALR